MRSCMLPNITFDELKSCPWKTIISKASNKDCLTYSSLFFDEASKHSEGTAEKRACQLLASLCSMDFADAGNEAYTPMYSGPNGHTVFPQDLSEQHVEALYQFLSEVDDPELKARLADSIWLKKKIYKFESANIAITEYIKTINNLKITSESDAIKRLCRVVNLAYEIGSKEKQQQLLDYVEKYAMNTATNLPYGYHYKLFQILCDRKHGNLQDLAIKCKDIANYHKSINNYHLMRLFLNLHYKFMEISDADSNTLKDIKIEETESYVLQANNESSAMKKTYFLELAINAFRNIKDCSDRINELHTQLIIEQKNVPNEMISFRTTEIDITQIVKESESLVSGLNLFDALIRLSFILNIPSETDLRKKTLYSIQRNPLCHLFQKRFTNEEGKTTGKIAPIDFHNLSINDDIVTAEMFRNMSIQFNFYAEAKILPALDRINIEHSITLDDLNCLLTNNPFIPQGHELLYARGLLAG